MELDPPFAPTVGILNNCSSDDEIPKGGTKASDLPAILPLAFERPAVHSLPVAEHDINTHLQQELDLSRYDHMIHRLWMAGPARPCRSLHQQRMMDRQIVVAEQADLHLVWFEKTIFVKPLPQALLRYVVWKQSNLCSPAYPNLRKSACGLLLSYTWLVRHESDLKIALELGLLPTATTWATWLDFAHSFLGFINAASLDHVHRRYVYGELRLGRLNWMTRIPTKGNFSIVRMVRGYSYGYNRRDAFLNRNFAWLITATVFLGIVLTAMQLGLATDRLSTNATFQQVCYGVTVFSIVLPLALLFVTVVISVLLILATIPGHLKPAYLSRNKDLKSNEDI